MRIKTRPTSPLSSGSGGFPGRMTQRTKPKPKQPHTTIPEATRRKRGQVQVKVRMMDTQLDDLRREHGQPGDSSAKVIKRACGLA